MEVRVHITVRGVVQGVGFRYFVYKRAAVMKLSGWVRNLAGGEVEIEAEGPRSLLEELISAVKVGPPHAHVSELSVDWKEPTMGTKGFLIQ